MQEVLKHRIAWAMHKLKLYEILDSGREITELSTLGKKRSFSQFGEDQFLVDYFGSRCGLYIDIGGNHPFRLSNTYLLYRQGWHGIVVEPIRRLYLKHKRFRPRDVQVNAAASDNPGTLRFFEIVPSLLSTCDPQEAAKTLQAQGALLLDEYTVPIVTVAHLYRKHLAPAPIALLSVDTEGHDLAVLRGIDWHSMRPEVVICEANDAPTEEAVKSLLGGQKYECVKSLGCNRIFVSRA